MEELHKASKIAFATTFSFYLKAHNFHWNTQGRTFFQDHELLGKIYEEVYGSIDNFAEKIRSLGTFVPASYTRFSMLTEIEDEVEILESTQMIQVLLADNVKLIQLLKIVYDIAEHEGKHGYSNFLAERMDAHEKHGWMLESTLK